MNRKANKTASTGNTANDSKKKPIIEDKEPINFTERFRNWLAAYTKDPKEKIWMDVEYFQ